MALQTEATTSQETRARATDEPFIFCENLVKIYKVADLEAVALQGLDLQIQRGELMAIIGNSGSGKSTLLNILGGLDRPSAGRVTVGGRDLLKMSERQFVRYKREVVGFIWQNTSRCRWCSPDGMVIRSASGRASCSTSSASPSA